MDLARSNLHAVKLFAPQQMGVQKNHGALTKPPQRALGTIDPQPRHWGATLIG